MGSSLGSLVVRLGLDAADYTSGLVKAEAAAARFANTSGQSFTAVSRAAKETSKTLDYLTTGFKSVAAAFGIREIAKLSDEFSNVSARLKLVTASTDEYTRVQNTLLGISNETRTSFATTANLFYRVSQAALDLGTSQKDVIQLTDGLNKALIVSGASGSTAKGALEQLAQALGANQLRGQEFNTVNEQANRIMLALADGLGKTAGELRQMANDGEITTEVFIRGFLKGATKLNEEFKKVPITISGALTVAENNLQQLIGKMNQSSGATGLLAKGIVILSEHIDVLAAAAATFGAAKLGTKLFEITAATYANAEASVAATAATRARAVVEVATAEAEVARLAATEAAIVAARAQTIAELQLVQALIAKGTVTASFASVQIAELAALGTAQAGLVAKTAAAEAALLAAQKAQQATTLGAGLLGRALGFLSGPIGITITVLGTLAAAWGLYGTSAANANEDARRDTEKSTADILANLNKQIDRLRERNALAAGGGPNLPDTAEGREAAQLLQEAKALRETNSLDRLNDEKDAQDKVTIATDRWLQVEGMVTDELIKQNTIIGTGNVLQQAAKKEAQGRAIIEAIGTRAREQATSEDFRSRKTLDQLLGENANKAEKLATALADAKKQLGLASNQEFSALGPKGVLLEQRIREKFKEPAGPKDDPSKKIIDGQIAAIETQVAREKDILRAQEDFLKDAYGDGYLSVKNYYDRLEDARAENLRSTLRAYDDEITALETYRDKVATKSVDKQDAQNKIDTKRESRVNLLRDEGFKEQSLNRDRIRATEQYTASLDEANAKILELGGNTADAALIRFDETNKSLVRMLKAASGLDKTFVDLQRAQIKNADGTFSTEKTITVEMDDKFFLIPTIVDGIERGTEEAVQLFVAGLNKAVGEFKSAAEAEAAAVQRSAFIGQINDPNTDQGKAARALKQLQDQREQVRITGELNDKAKEYGITLGYLDLATQHINNQRQLGNVGELTALAQISASNRELLPLLQAEADAYAKRAEKSKDPADLLKARQLQEAVKTLGQQVDLVADKFNNIFGTAFADQLTAFVTGAKTLKQAALDFGKDVNTQIVKSIADEFKAKLFGQGGALSGIGTKLSDLFGFGKKDAKDVSTPPLVPEDVAKILGQGKDAATQATKDAASLASAQALATAQLTLSTATETSATAMLSLSTSTEVGSTAQLAFSTASEAASVVMATLTAAASAAAAALVAVAASSAASGAGGILGSLGSSAGSIFNSSSPFQGPSFGAAAAGTNFAFGGTTWVGEHGPELVNMPRGAQVVPNEQVNNYTNRKGGDTHININQTIHGPATGASLRQQRAAARDGVMSAIRDR